MNQVITHARMATQMLVILFVVTAMLNQCTLPERQTEEETEYRKEFSVKLYKIRDENSLRIVLHQFIEKKYDVGKMICYKQLGSLQRKRTRYFDECYAISRVPKKRWKYAKGQKFANPQLHLFLKRGSLKTTTAQQTIYRKWKFYLFL